MAVSPRLLHKGGRHRADCRDSSHHAESSEGRNHGATHHGVEAQKKSNPYRGAEELSDQAESQDSGEMHNFVRSHGPAKSQHRKEAISYGPNGQQTRAKQNLPSQDPGHLHGLTAAADRVAPQPDIETDPERTAGDSQARHVSGQASGAQLQPKRFSPSLGRRGQKAEQGAESAREYGDQPDLYIQSLSQKFNSAAQRQEGLGAMVRAVDADIQRKQEQAAAHPHQDEEGELLGLAGAHAATPTPQFEGSFKKNKKKSKKLNSDSGTMQGPEVFYNTEIGLKN